jgi:2-polyprenyl-3-methyl-5-hydroxy-6-metoxy-1,4-benzoquinol methylase
MRIKIQQYRQNSMDALVDYYDQRAHEYEQIYKKPERQEDLKQLHGWLCNQLKEKDILEVACGTGYWTVLLSQGASSITALDASAEALRLAKSKTYPRSNVRFQQGDAYQLNSIAGQFDAAFLGFWWSHVPKQDHGRFLMGLHQRIGAGHVIVMVDNRFVQGSSTTISRTDAEGNTYQLRRLADGSHHEVLKNFPTKEELQAMFAKQGAQLNILQLEYYWGVSYLVNPSR